MKAIEEQYGVLEYNKGYAILATWSDHPPKEIFKYKYKSQKIRQCMRLTSNSAIP